MKHFAHLFRWEIYRSRGVLVVWLVIVGANAVFEAAWPMLAANRGFRQLAGTLGNLMSIAEILLSVVIVARVVHADALVGTRAFWTTRPIRPGLLFTAKLAFLATMLVAPKIVSEIVVMSMYHVAVADMLGVSAQTALLWSLWVVVLMAAAVMTSNLAQFALLIGSALVAFAITIALMIAVAMNRFESMPPLSTPDVGPQDPTSGIVASLLIVISALFVLVAQYRTRRRVLSSLVGAAGLVVSYAIASAWRWPLLAPVLMTPVWAADPAMLALAASTDTVNVERGMWIRDQPIDWKEARAQIRMRGLEPGWTASVALRRAVLQIPGKGELTSPYAAQPATVLVEGHNGEHQNREVVRRLLEVASVIDERTPERGENAIIMFTRGAEIGRLAPAEGAYAGQFRVALRRHVIEGVLPLRLGAIHQSGPHRLVIREIRFESDHLSVLADESDAVSAFARRPQTLRTVYLRNRRSSHAVLGSSFPLRTDVTLLRLLPVSFGYSAGEPSGFTLEAQAIDFPPTFARQDLPVVLDETWINDAELVVVRSTEEGSVSRELRISDFPIR